MTGLNECIKVAKQIVSERDMDLYLEHTDCSGLNEDALNRYKEAWSSWDGSEPSQLQIKEVNVSSYTEYTQKFSAFRNWNIEPEQIIIIIEKSSGENPVSLTLTFGAFERKGLWYFSAIRPDEIKPSIVKNDVWTDLKESDHAGSSWSLAEIETGGSYQFNYEGVRLDLALEKMQDQGIISSKWIIGKEFLPSQFYDINLGEESWDSKAEIAPAFYAWVNQHFALEIGEQDVSLESWILKPPKNNPNIQRSEQSVLSMQTINFGGEFGMQFNGITWMEFCYWLRKETQQPVFCNDESSVRYNFFLPHPIIDKIGLLDEVKKLDFSLVKENMTVHAVVIKKRDHRDP